MLEIIKEVKATDAKKAADAKKEAEMENYITADLTYIIDDGPPSIRYVDWPEEEHKAHIATYEKRTTKISCKVWLPL